MAQFSWMMTQVEYFILVKIGQNVMELVTYKNIRRTRELFQGRKKRISNSWAGGCGMGIMTSDGSYSNPFICPSVLSMCQHINICDILKYKIYSHVNTINTFYCNMYLDL